MGKTVERRHFPLCEAFGFTLQGWSGAETGTGGNEDSHLRRSLETQRFLVVCSLRCRQGTSRELTGTWS